MILTTTRFIDCSLLLAFVPHLSPTPSSGHRASGHHRRRRSADGYSLYALSVPVSAAPAFLPNILFRLDADFVPVIKIPSYNVLVANLAGPAN
jgi:hypothetical protein